MGDRKKPKYIMGVNQFLEYAFSGKGEGTEMRCPCVHYNLYLFRNQSTIHNQLIVRGVLRDYNPWIHHGESEGQANSSDDKMDDELLDKGDSLFPHDDTAPLICEATNVFTYDNPETTSTILRVEKVAMRFLRSFIN